MSKKILPTASTLIRAVVVALFGTVMVSEPSLGVLAAMVIGKVLPPSVDREIFTLAALIGDAEVLATFQVTDCDDPPCQLTAVFGCVTAKGPAVETTLTCIAALAVPPPAARLSRAVKRKFMVRVVEGSVSPEKQVLEPQETLCGG